MLYLISSDSQVSIFVSYLLAEKDKHTSLEVITNASVDLLYRKT